MRKKSLILSLVFIFLLLSQSFSYVHAQTQQITDGLSYLKSVQNPDGSWYGTLYRGILPTTVTTIETLSVLEQENSQNYSNAISWLQTQDLDTTDYLSERIYALSIAGTDLNLLLSYIDQVSLAWGGYESYRVNNLDTVSALYALKKINYPDQNVIYPAINYLTSNQNADGGWGYCPSSNTGCGDGTTDSNVYMTATVLQSLIAYDSIFDIQDSINKAAAYILVKQNPDGSFVSSTGSEGTVYETALALRALANVKPNLFEFRGQKDGK